MAPPTPATVPAADVAELLTGMHDLITAAGVDTGALCFVSGYLGAFLGYCAAELAAGDLFSMDAKNNRARFARAVRDVKARYPGAGDVDEDLEEDLEQVEAGEQVPA